MKDELTACNSNLRQAQAHIQQLLQQNDEDTKGRALLEDRLQEAQDATALESTKLLDLQTETESEVKRLRIELDKQFQGNRTVHQQNEVMAKENQLLRRKLESMKASTEWKAERQYEVIAKSLQHKEQQLLQAQHQLRDAKFEAKFAVEKARAMEREVNTTPAFFYLLCSSKLHAPSNS